MVVAPTYLSGELIHDHWPSTHSALGLGLGAGLFAASHSEFRRGDFESRESFWGDVARATLAYYLRGPKIAGLLPLEG